MQKLIFLVVAVLVSTYSFADIQSLSLNDPSQLQSLKAAWQSTLSYKQNVIDETNIIYGGADITNDQRFTHQKQIIV